MRTTSRPRTRSMAPPIASSSTRKVVVAQYHIRLVRPMPTGGPLAGGDFLAALSRCLGGLFQRKRSVLDRPGALIGRDHDAGGRGLHRVELESDRDRPIGEETLSRSEKDRERPHVELVDEVVLEKRLQQIAAAVHLDLRAGLLLELGDVLCDIARYERGVLPLDASQRPR